MSNDWRPGDLALCVNDEPPRVVNGHLETPDPTPLRAGAVYTVLRVARDVRGYGYLGLAVHTTDSGWFADRFRKLDPHAPDEDDREIIALYTYAPLQTPEPVE